MPALGPLTCMGELCPAHDTNTSCVGGMAEATSDVAPSADAVPGLITTPPALLADPRLCPEPPPPTPSLTVDTGEAAESRTVLAGDAALLGWESVGGVPCTAHAPGAAPRATVAPAAAACAAAAVRAATGVATSPGADGTPLVFARAAAGGVSMAASGTSCGSAAHTAG